MEWLMCWLFIRSCQTGTWRAKDQRLYRASSSPRPANRSNSSAVLTQWKSRSAVMRTCTDRILRSSASGKTGSPAWWQKIEFYRPHWVYSRLCQRRRLSLQAITGTYYMDKTYSARPTIWEVLLQQMLFFERLCTRLVSIEVCEIIQNFVFF